MSRAQPARSAGAAARLVRVAEHEVARRDDIDPARLAGPLVAVFDEAARQVPEQPFLVSDARPGEGYAYGAFVQEARALAGALVARGVVPGARVGLWCPNRPRWCVAYAAVLFAAAVVVPLDAELDVRHLPGVAADAAVRVLFTAGDRVEAAAGVLGEQVVVLGLDDSGPRSYRDELRVGTGVELPPPGAGDEEVALLYTSGTTGSPKAVVLTHRNMLAEIRGLEVAACISSSEVLLMLLPLHHLLAQLGSFVLAAAFRARVVDVQARNGDELLAQVRRHGVTVLLAVPLLLHLIHERIEKKIAARGLAGRLLARSLLRANGASRRVLGLNAGKLLFRDAHRAFGPALRLIVSGGSALDPRAQRTLFRLGFTVLQAYGLTETCGAATVTDERDPTVGSVGWPFAGVSIRIADPDASGVGEVLVAGGIVTPGYRGKPDATAEVLREGWLHTGDLGRLDARGRLWLTGRSKDVIVLGSGKNVYPEEVEAHYAQADHVAEICVISARRGHGPDRTEKLHAVVVPDWDRLQSDGITSVRSQLHFELESLSLRLPPWQRVLTFEIRRQPLPRTATRKVQRFQVTAEAGTGSTSSDAPPDQPDVTARLESELGQAVAEVVRERCGGDATVRGGASLELDLGLDSLNRMELLLALEQRLGISITDEEAERLSTVDDVVVLLERKAAAGGGAAAAGSSWPALVDASGEADLPRWMSGPPGPLVRFGRAVAQAAMRLLAHSYFRLRVEGREHLPPAGPYLLCPNHVSFLDAPALLVALPRAVRVRTFALGEADYMETYWGQLICRLFQVVPTNANRALRPSMRAAAAALKRGQVLIVFPEGTRSPDGELKELKHGSAILACELDLPIVPCAIDGAYRSWPRGRTLPRPGSLRVRFGPALSSAGKSYDALTTELGAAITALGRPR